MPCLFAIFAGLFPRLGVLFLWLARPSMFSAAFDGSWLLPVLGVIRPVRESRPSRNVVRKMGVVCQNSF